jgi:hypothetical protein
MAFDVISQEGKNRILTMEDLLKESTDENIWGFVKPTMDAGGNIFLQTFDLPYDDTTVKEQKLGIRRYAYFETEIERAWLSLNQSPGQNLYKQLERLFEGEIVQFFEEGKIARWEPRDYSLDGQVKRMFSMGRGRPEDDVPSDARLCVVMDEPTIFLDAVNKFNFQRKMAEMAERYSGRLQFCIASNDYALIQGQKGGCVYINLYEQPAVSSRTFEIQSYLSGSGAL